jgi:hypothetical protein
MQRSIESNVSFETSRRTSTTYGATFKSHYDASIVNGTSFFTVDERGESL